MNRCNFFLVVGLLAVSARAAAFESDVHYGLTQWLALKAGFDPQAARTIAIGNNRVDSGDMQFVDLVFMYACAARDDVGSRRAREHHYPSAVPDAAAPEARAVAPGGEAARKAAIDAVKVAPDQAAYRLFKLGDALHSLQDSWSHQGTPDTPQPVGGLLGCDATRAWGHPKARGGWNSHKADLTMHWPADTIAMAKATYDVLTQYPSVSGVKRTPRRWDEIRPALDRFVTASTKTEKKRWFASQGIDDVAFLEGISLNDGAEPFLLAWPARKLPELGSPQSRQHAVNADLLDFYNRFFARWVSATDFPALADEFGPEASPNDAKSRAVPSATAKAEFAARLKAWRLRDHGRIADIAHSLQPLSARDRATLDTAAKEPSAYARYDSPADAFFPLLPRGDGASPLLPFFVWTPTAAAGKNPTAVAAAKFRHLPYDTVAVVAEQVGGRWRAVSIVSVVEH